MVYPWIPLWIPPVEGSVGEAEREGSGEGDGEGDGDEVEGHEDWTQQRGLVLEELEEHRARFPSRSAHGNEDPTEDSDSTGDGDAGGADDTSESGDAGDADDAPSGVDVQVNSLAGRAKSVEGEGGDKGEKGGKGGKGSGASRPSPPQMRKSVWTRTQSSDSPRQSMDETLQQVSAHRGRAASRAWDVNPINVHEVPSHMINPTGDGTHEQSISNPLSNRSLLSPTEKRLSADERAGGPGGAAHSRVVSAMSEGDFSDWDPDNEAIGAERRKNEMFQSEQSRRRSKRTGRTDPVNVLRLKIIQAKGLAKGDSVHCRVYWNNTKVGKTPVVKGSTDPVWEGHPNIDVHLKAKNPSSFQLKAGGKEGNRKGSGDERTASKASLARLGSVATMGANLRSSITGMEEGDKDNDLCVEVWQKSLLTHTFLGQAVLDKESVEQWASLGSKFSFPLEPKFSSKKKQKHVQGSLEMEFTAPALRSRNRSTGKNLLSTRGSTASHAGGGGGVAAAASAAAAAATMGGGKDMTGGGARRPGDPPTRSLSRGKDSERHQYATPGERSASGGKNLGAALVTPLPNAKSERGSFRLGKGSDPAFADLASDPRTTSQSSRQLVGGRRTAPGALDINLNMRDALDALTESKYGGGGRGSERTMPQTTRARMGAALRGAEGDNKWTTNKKTALVHVMGARGLSRRNQLHAKIYWNEAKAGKTEKTRGTAPLWSQSEGNPCKVQLEHPALPFQAWVLRVEVRSGTTFLGEAKIFAEKMLELSKSPDEPHVVPLKRHSGLSVAKQRNVGGEVWLSVRGLEDILKAQAECRHPSSPRSGDPTGMPVHASDSFLMPKLGVRPSMN